MPALTSSEGQPAIEGALVPFKVKCLALQSCKGWTPTKGLCKDNMWLENNYTVAQDVLKKTIRIHRVCNTHCVTSLGMSRCLPCLVSFSWLDGFCHG